LIRSLPDGVLLWQVACEYLAASRKLEPLGYGLQDAWQDVEDLRSVWTTIIPTWPVLDRARKLMSKFSFSFWDSLVVATCLESGVEYLHTEDFDGYPMVDGLRITNPFAANS